MGIYTYLYSSIETDDLILSLENNMSSQLIVSGSGLVLLGLLGFGVLVKSTNSQAVPIGHWLVSLFENYEEIPYSVLKRIGAVSYELYSIQYVF